MSGRVRLCAEQRALLDLDAATGLVFNDTTNETI
jgi:hypothetical protein